MIVIDRTLSKPVAEQLIEQLRYQVVGGRYQIGDALPSTRVLAEQLGISFHTVRKAYQQLEREGLLKAITGSGYTVQEPSTPSKADRIERGAKVVQQTLQQLVSLGLDEPEIESVFHEQLELLGDTYQPLKLIFADESVEIAEVCARQVANSLQRNVQAVRLIELAQHQDADFVFAACHHLRTVLSETPRADVLGVVLYLHHDVMERVARLLPHQTLGLVTRFADTIPPLTSDLRQHAGFDGQVLAVSIEDVSLRLHDFARQTDLLLYTPDCRRKLHGVLDDSRVHAVIAPVVSRESLEAIRTAVPA